MAKETTNKHLVFNNLRLEEKTSVTGKEHPLTTEHECFNKRLTNCPIEVVIYVRVAVENIRTLHAPVFPRAAAYTYYTWTKKHFLSPIIWPVYYQWEVCILGSFEHLNKVGVPWTLSWRNRDL